MNKKIVTLCLLSAFALSLSACSDKTGMNISPNGSQTIASIGESQKIYNETEEKEQQAASAEETVETTLQSETQNEIPMIGGSDYTFSRKYIDKVYNIYMAAEVVGVERRDEWVNNVFLLQTPEEQEALPPIYQMIRDLSITKEEFIAENDKYVDYPDMYFSEEIISALYQEDIDEMKRLLASPFALYYDGEVYTFDELSQSQNTRMTANIPADVMNNYLGYIELVCEENGIIKYMQEDIDRVQNTYQLAVEQDEINSESDVTDWVNDVTDFDSTETDFEENDVPDLEDNPTDSIYDEIPFSPDEN